MSTETVEGHWYVHSENTKLVVDHEGFTVADVASAQSAKRIVRDHNSNAADLLAALERMVALMESLWKCIPWGQSWNLPVAELNEAPIQAKRAILAART